MAKKMAPEVTSFFSEAREELEAKERAFQEMLELLEKIAPLNEALLDARDTLEAAGVSRRDIFRVTNAGLVERRILQVRRPDETPTTTEKTMSEADALTPLGKNNDGEESHVSEPLREW